MTSDVLLEAKDVEVRFGGVKALDGINFRLKRGEMRCLIGPNGAGKTTFFRCLTGRQAPTKGAIEFKGRPLDRESFRIARGGIGIKTQVPSLFEQLSAYEHLWLASRKISDEGERRVAIGRIFDRVEINHLRNATVGRMAHGERQLVELAMIIAADPELILLDEPAAGMTHRESGRLIEIIKEINKSHTIVVVEHDMDFVRKVATSVTVFNRGKILAEGDVEDVLNDAQVKLVYLGETV